MKEQSLWVSLNYGRSKGKQRKAKEEGNIDEHAMSGGEIGIHGVHSKMDTVVNLIPSYVQH
jgi:hypothetical protein